MEQTAVEWLVEELKGVYQSEYLNKLTKQANEMFKEQIKNAYQTSHISMMTAEQYYNETFKNK